MRVCFLILVVSSAAVLSLVFNGCSSSGSRTVEGPITVEAATLKSAGTAVMKPIAAPTAQETEAAVARLFKGDVAVVGGRQSMVLVGDFNGDSSTDLAVAVKPNPGKLNEVNATLANWTVQDPHRSYVAPKDKSVVVLPPTEKAEKVKPGETLLVVIHGCGAEGWRDPLATQTYLLRNSVGTGARVAKPSQALAKDFGPFPSPRDVISESYAGKHGVIYWTGAAYAWHAEVNRSE
jgi:hypothetical protein